MGKRKFAVSPRNRNDSQKGVKEFTPKEGEAKQRKTLPLRDVLKKKQKRKLTRESRRANR